MKKFWMRRRQCDSETPPDATTPEESDLDLVERARHDPAAFSPLYERYYPIVLGFCQRRLGQPDLAADTTSEIFTKAISNLHRFVPDPARSGSTFRSWLFAIAHNAVIDAHRRGQQSTIRHIRPTADEDEPDPVARLVDPAVTPAEFAERNEADQRVQAMLRQLPDSQRQIVELRLAGLKGPEIAEALNMSHSAVKSAQYRAYATLRDLMRGPEQAEEPSPERANVLSS